MPCCDANDAGEATQFQSQANKSVEVEVRQGTVALVVQLALVVHVANIPEFQLGWSCLISKVALRRQTLAAEKP